MTWETKIPLIFLTYKRLQYYKNILYISELQTLLLV